MFICLMVHSAQLSVLFAVFSKTIKLNRVWEYLKFFNHLWVLTSFLIRNKRNQRKLQRKSKSLKRKIKKKRSKRKRKRRLKMELMLMRR
jgi:hypothetical protein